MDSKNNITLQLSFLTFYFLIFSNSWFWVLMFIGTVSSHNWFNSKQTVAQRLKRLPGMLETRVRSLGRLDPLKKEIATHSSTPAWRIPWTEEPGRLQTMRLQRVRHNWATFFSFFFFLLSSYASITAYFNSVYSLPLLLSLLDVSYVKYHNVLQKIVHMPLILKFFPVYSPLSTPQPEGCF